MSTCLDCCPHSPTPSRHEGVSVVTQYASPGLIQSIAYTGHDPAMDPAWPVSGAADQEEYKRWCGHLCGTACLKMVLHHRDGHAPPLFELAAGIRKYGGYTEQPDGGIRGLIYAPFAAYAREEHGLHADVHPRLDVEKLIELIDDGQLVLASVHWEIRSPELPPPGKGGHLVLVIGRGKETIVFHNPSGHTALASAAELPTGVFSGFFAGRGVGIRMR